MKRKLAILVMTVLLSMSLLAGTASAAYIADMSYEHWAYSYVDTLVDRGVMDTDEYGNFYPDVPTSRGEFVLCLWRAFGSPAVDAENPQFIDVGWDSPYIGAVEWAVANQITYGLNNLEFGPEYSLTREQAFTFLYSSMKYAGVAPEYGYNHEFLKQITEFNDYQEISSWAADPMQLLLDIGIVSGSDTGYLWPKQDVNNAATATILYNAMVYMNLI